MDVYLINLDTSVDRLERMAERLRGVPFRRSAARDGRGAPGNGVLSGAEIGCAGSHMAVWHAIMESGAPHACIIEDDAVLSRHFAGMIGSDDWLPPSFDIVKLETCLGRVRLSRRGRNFRNHRIARMLSPHVNAAGYIISRSGIEKAMPLATPLSAQIDQAIFNGPGLAMEIYQVVPALVVQERLLTGSNADSAIRPEGYRPPKCRLTFLRKLEREAKRLSALPKKLSWDGPRIPFSDAEESISRIARPERG